MHNYKNIFFLTYFKVEIMDGVSMTYSDDDDSHYNEEYEAWRYVCCIDEETCETRCMYDTVYRVIVENKEEIMITAMISLVVIVVFIIDIVVRLT